MNSVALIAALFLVASGFLFAAGRLRLHRAQRRRALVVPRSASSSALCIARLSGRKADRCAAIFAAVIVLLPWALLVRFDVPEWAYFPAGALAGELALGVFLFLRERTSRRPL
jgi:hypothetical protein